MNWQVAAVELPPTTTSSCRLCETGNRDAIGAVVADQPCDGGTNRHEPAAGLAGDRGGAADADGAVGDSGSQREGPDGAVPERMWEPRPLERRPGNRGPIAVGERETASGKQRIDPAGSSPDLGRREQLAQLRPEIAGQRRPKPLQHGDLILVEATSSPGAAAHPAQGVQSARQVPPTAPGATHAG